MPYILITGASSGIGYNTTRYLIEQGCTVFASVRTAGDKERLGRDFPNHFHCLLFDVTDRNAIQEAVTQVEEVLGDNLLAALVNNAGVALGGPLELIDDEQFEKQFEINVLGTRYVINAFLPLLGASLQRAAYQKPGKIINISSISGILNTPINGSYSIAKHAMESMGEVYRRELYMYGIDVVSIQPGPIQSEIWQKTIGTMAEFANTDYGPMIDRVDTILQRARQDALPADVISGLIYRIIRSRRPKTAYIVHSRVWSVRVMSKWLPARWVDYMLNRQLTKPLKKRG